MSGKKNESEITRLGKLTRRLHLICLLSTVLRVSRSKVRKRNPSLWSMDGCVLLLILQEAAIRGFEEHLNVVTVLVHA